MATNLSASNYPGAAVTAKAHHDAYCQSVTEAATLVCHTWVAFVKACAQFVEVANQQIDPLTVLPDASGQPAFDLPDGQAVLQRMLTVFPNQPSTLMQSVLSVLREPMTVGQSQAILAHVTGQYPFSQGLVDRFLKGYAYEPESV